jgi:hypothetical protein
MMKSSSGRPFGVATGLVSIVALVLMTATPAVATSSHLGGRLYGASGYSYARGHADYEQHSGYREFDVDLWNMSHLSGATLTVYAGPHKIGTTRVGSSGCHLHRDTRNGQYVPSLSAGATVKVLNARGALVAKGTLHRMMMM